MSDMANPIKNDITAVVLAGGASSRMGEPKALLRWQGERFIDHIVRQLREQADKVAISSNHAAMFETLQMPILADPFAESHGPLAGMLSGLRFSTTALTLFVPCDTPLIAPDLARRLHAALLGRDADIAYAVSGGNSHYLFALMRTTLHASLAEQLARGDRAVYRWFTTQRHIPVAFDAHDRYFININTPEALSQLHQSGY
jgi:molybdenum cofactor guanylyltransferase